MGISALGIAIGVPQLAATEVVVGDIVTFGDSITVGQDVLATERYGRLLADDYGTTEKNGGDAGTVLSDVDARADNGVGRIGAFIDDYANDVGADITTCRFIILYGTNDFRDNGLNSPSEFKTDLTTCVTTANTKGISSNRIVLCTIPAIMPWKFIGTAPFDAGNTSDLIEYNKVIREVAQEQGTLFCDVHLAMIDNDLAVAQGGDGTHPPAAGHVIIKNAIKLVIDANIVETNSVWSISSSEADTWKTAADTAGTATQLDRDKAAYMMRILKGISGLETKIKFIQPDLGDFAAAATFLVNNESATYTTGYTSGDYSSTNGYTGDSTNDIDYGVDFTDLGLSASSLTYAIFVHNVHNGSGNRMLCGINGASGSTGLADLYFTGSETLTFRLGNDTSGQITKASGTGFEGAIAVTGRALNDREMVVEGVSAGTDTTTVGATIPLDQNLYRGSRGSANFPNTGDTFQSFIVADGCTLSQLVGLCAIMGYRYR